MRKQIITSLVLLTVILLVSQAQASGIVSPYWPGNPNKVAPGSENVVEMTIQNMVGEEDLTFRAEIIRNDGDIASLDEEEYDVPASTSDTQVLLHYSIPEDAQIGTVYTVIVSFETITSGEGGGVTMGTGMEMNIPFEVVAQSAEPAQSPAISKGLGISAYLAILTAVFVVAVLVILATKRKKRAISFDMPLR